MYRHSCVRILATLCPIISVKWHPWTFILIYNRISNVVLKISKSILHCNIWKWFLFEVYKFNMLAIALRIDGSQSWNIHGQPSCYSMLHMISLFSIAEKFGWLLMIEQVSDITISWRPLKSTFFVWNKLEAFDFMPCFNVRDYITIAAFVVDIFTTHVVTGINSTLFMIWLFDISLNIKI